MALDTYANLQTAIADTLDRSDLTSYIPDWITMAEAEMQRDIKHWRMEKRDTLTADAQYEDLPTDFLAPIRLNLSVSGYLRPLELSSSDYLQNLRYRSDDTGDYPTHYAIVGDQIEFYPTPSASVTVSIFYRRTIPALANDNTSNWLLALAPDAYLYGALQHSAPWLVEDERLPVWASLYAKAISGINLEGKRGRFGGEGLRMKVR